MRLEGHHPPRPRASLRPFKALPCQSAAPALRGKYYRGYDPLFCVAGPPAGLSEFPCIYPAYPGHPRATVGPALGPLRTLTRVDGRAESAGRPSFWTISPPNRPSTVSPEHWSADRHPTVGTATPPPRQRAQTAQNSTPGCPAWTRSHLRPASVFLRAYDVTQSARLVLQP